MKCGFPFLRALAAWTVQRMRGPLLAMVFLLLGAAVAPSVALCTYRDADHGLLSARICPLLRKPSELIIDNSHNTRADVCWSQGNPSRIGESEEDVTAGLGLAHEEV